MNTQDPHAITATPAAVAYIKKHLAKQQGNEPAAIRTVRLELKKEGCSGYRYDLTAMKNEEILEGDKIFPLSDELSLYVNRKFFPYVLGTVIDYQQMGLGGQLVYQNPNQTGACGCGESFTVG